MNSKLNSKFVFVLGLLLLSCQVFAVEKGGEEAVVVNEDYSGKQSSEWERAQIKLGNIKGRLDAQAALIDELISVKINLKGEALALKLDELKKEHLKLRKVTDEYNELNLEFLTKFPERGIKENRVYKRIKPKSLQTYEAEHTVQGSVDRLHSKILKQYLKTNVKSGAEPKQKKNKLKNNEIF